MKSSEQMGEIPEQLNNERKLTTPEEAKAMTQQRRNEYGLGPSRELTSEETKEIETNINKLLEQLDDYDFDSFGPEMQEAWYYAEMEAGACNDRELAKKVLERFLAFATIQQDGLRARYVL